MSPSQQPALPLLDSDIRESLQPFADLFETVLVQTAHQLRSRRAGKRFVSGLAGRLELAVKARLGNSLHPAIVCFALRLCSHHYYSASEATESNRAWQRQRRLVDRTHMLILKLEEHYHTDEFLLVSL